MPPLEQFEQPHKQIDDIPKMDNAEAEQLGDDEKEKDEEPQIEYTSL